MTRYTISDLHFGHANIIDYCDRPFSDVESMNTELIGNWNAIVDPDDTVLYMGDFGWWGVNILRLYERLNGTMLLVRGNHDEFDAGDVPFPVVESHTISHNGKTFYCEHYPITPPADESWWQIHGHTHNNDVGTYPFINPESRRVNVSCELLGYIPVSLDVICDLIDEGERVETY